VQLCQAACEGDGFGLSEGGFSSGNAHAQARCLCATGTGGDALQARLSRRANDAECATACSLHDARPCGGARALALFARLA
jgi:hypothetical protein